MSLLRVVYVSVALAVSSVACRGRPAPPPTGAAQAAPVSTQPEAEPTDPAIDPALAEALVAYVTAPSRRAQLSSWTFEHSAARLAMRRGRWAEAREHVERAIAELEAHPLSNPRFQAHFLRTLTEQRDVVMRALGE